MGKLAMAGIVVGVGLVIVAAFVALDSKAPPNPSLDAARGADHVTDVAADETEAALRQAAELSSAANPAENRKNALRGATYVAETSVEGAQRVTEAVNVLADDAPPPGDAGPEPAEGKAQAASGP